MCAECCKNEDGYYHNFIGNVEFHMDEPWYNVRDLLRVLRRMKKLDFSYPGNREFYITEARGCWGEIFHQLKKTLAKDCSVKFEIGKASLPRSWKKQKQGCCQERNDCAGTTMCCNNPEVGSEFDHSCDENVDENYPSHCEHSDDYYCPISSDICDDCLGPEPPSCCPNWLGECKVQKIPQGSFKCYIKNFRDIIEKMLRGIEKKDNVFSRKTFEKHYKVVWTRYKKKCDILENSDSDDDYICEDCCREEQEQGHYFH